MRKISFFLSLVLLAGLMVPAAYAAPESSRETEVIHTEAGDFEIETTTVIYDSAARSSSKTAGRTQTIKYGGKVIAEVTLTAAFGYDGTTVWVISANGSFRTYDNWVYGNEKITKSGGTASLSATLSHAIHGTLAVNISLTCSPTGAIT